MLDLQAQRVIGETEQGGLTHLVEAEISSADPVNLEDSAQRLGREAGREDPAHLGSVTPGLCGQAGHSTELARLLKYNTVGRLDRGNYSQTFTENISRTLRDSTNAWLSFASFCGGVDQTDLLWNYKEHRI